MFINNDDLEKCGLFCYAEDPYLKILQTDARKLLAVVKAAEELFINNLQLPFKHIDSRAVEKIRKSLQELEGE